MNKEEINKAKAKVEKKFNELAKQRQQIIQALENANKGMEQLRGQFQLLKEFEEVEEKPKKDKK